LLPEISFSGSRRNGNLDFCHFSHSVLLSKASFSQRFERLLDSSSPAESWFERSGPPSAEKDIPVLLPYPLFLPILSPFEGKVSTPFRGWLFPSFLPRASAFPDTFAKESGNPLPLFKKRTPATRLYVPLRDRWP
jgi:hypothetical protein